MKKYFAGIDIGSLTTKVVLIDEKTELVSSCVVYTGYDGLSAAKEALEETLKKAAISRDQIQQAISTGYGRHLVTFANKAVTEITCHAHGALYFFPNARTVLDIGGQDSKAIGLDPVARRVINFRMNDKCAAGTGRFLEVMAQRLRIGMDRMVELALKAKKALEISSVCTVFAETEVVSMVAQNKPVEEILKGLHQAVVNRVYPMLRDVGIKEEFVMTGGVAKNRAILKALEEKVGIPPKVPPDPQITGALGAALLALENKES